MINQNISQRSFDSKIFLFLMKIRKIITLISILLITAVGLIITEDIKAAESSVTYEVQAQASDNFVESMGINTKFGYCPGYLCDNYPKVKNLLAQLGIRYIRDVPYPESWRRRKDLYQDYGIQMLVGADRSWGQPLDSETIPDQLTAIKSWGKMIVGITGVNEYDNLVYQSCEETEGCDPKWSETSWPSSYRQFQQKLYKLVKADRELGHLPVILGPMAHLNNLQHLDNLSDACDRGNDHSYPGSWGKPSQESGGGQPRSMDEVVAKVKEICPGKKLWITETGYKERIEGDRHENLVSRQIKAKYLPRIYANYFQQGQIEKTFLHQLMETRGDRTGFGIIDPNLQPTSAYYGIKNLISLLGEATWDRQTQSWNYPNVKTDSLKYTLKGDLKDLKHLLLQKSNGTFYLLIWQEVYSYDHRLKQDLINPDRIVKFQLDDAIIKKAKTYRVFNKTKPSATLSPLKTWNNVSNLFLSVPDHILVLEFTASTQGQ